MSTFNEREKGYEAKYEREQQLRFKAINRRNKALAQWAAELLGLSGDAADQYEKDVIDVYLTKASDESVHDKVRADLEAKNVDLSDHRLRKKMDELYDQAMAVLQAEG